MNTWSTRLARVVFFFDRIGQYMFPLLVLLIVFDVLGRRVFSLPTVSFQEAEWHVHGVLFLLTVGATYLRNGHVRVEILHEKLSARAHDVIELVGGLVFVLPYMAVIFWFSVQFAWSAFVSGEGSSAAEGLSHRWIIKAVLPLGALLVALATVAVMLRRIAALRSRAS